MRCLVDVAKTRHISEIKVKSWGYRERWKVGDNHSIYYTYKNCWLIIGMKKLKLEEMK